MNGDECDRDVRASDHGMEDGYAVEWTSRAERAAAANTDAIDGAAVAAAGMAAYGDAVESIERVEHASVDADAIERHEHAADADAFAVEPPEVSRKVRRLRRSTKRTRPRSKTIAMKRLTMSELALGALMYPPTDEHALRPKTRAECRGHEGPCPWVACKHHLYLDINPETGSIKINFPDLEPWELQHSCALDIAEEGALTLEEIGAVTNLTRERVRQVEVRGLLKLRHHSRALR